MTLLTRSQKMLAAKLSKQLGTYYFETSHLKRWIYITFKNGVIDCENISSEEARDRKLWSNWINLISLRDSEFSGTDHGRDWTLNELKYGFYNFCQTIPQEYEFSQNIKNIFKLTSKMRQRA